MRKVFISYVRENMEIVDRLCQELRSRGIEVWLDRMILLQGRAGRGKFDGLFNKELFLLRVSQRNIVRVIVPI